jgi:hypothetical protein
MDSGGPDKLQWLPDSSSTEIQTVACRAYANLCLEGL